MNTLHATIATTGAALTLPSLCFAHGGEDGATLYHYLSSPDHLIVFGMLAVAALGACRWLSRIPRTAARRQQRPPC